MKTTTTKIATTFTAAIAAGAKGLVTVISAAGSSRLRWRYVSGVQNPGVAGQRPAWLADRLAMRHAMVGAIDIDRRPTSVCSERRPSLRFADRLLAAF